MDASRLDEETVERLLDGSRGGGSAGPRALVECLDAVRAGPRPGELAGEAAAVTEFRAARAAAHVGVGQAAGGSVRRPTADVGVDGRPARRLATLLSVKLAGAALIATLTGGVALAAATGTLPGTTWDETPSADRTTAGAPPTSGPPRTARPTHPGTGPTAGAPDLSTPAGLCVAYRAVTEGERGRALDAPAFAGLVAAAGGPARVPGYCTALLDASGSPVGPTGRPSGGPPTGPPTRSVPDPGTGGPPSGTAAPESSAARTPAAPTAGTARSPAGRQSGSARPPGHSVPGSNEPTGRRAG
ncbi:hypothetical protein [Micromonospora robiginosa]|uniref:Uncharacterized protein n=1 Tax=Micromonospora robiginosa TaxID=2749844 RepID=A0A7L6AZH9_9ACTN|nr:hypothetical protein [Micromonospora ferruginea]QLQ35006.1 hypothetical protein H1D33_16395 [Micromonospora ferruginea]